MCCLDFDVCSFTFVVYVACMPSLKSVFRNYYPTLLKISSYVYRTATQSLAAASYNIVTIPAAPLVSLSQLSPTLSSQESKQTKLFSLRLLFYWTCQIAVPSVTVISSASWRVSVDVSHQC